VLIPVFYLVTQKVPAKGHKKATVKKVVKTLARGSLTVAPGHAAEVAVALPASVATVVAKAKRLPATAQITAFVTGAPVQTLPVAVTLTPQKAPKKKSPPAKKKP